MGRKASDEFSLPLCRVHHRLVHRAGNEAAWRQEVGIDPLNAARKLRSTRLDEARPIFKNKKEAAAAFDRPPEPKDVESAPCALSR